MGRSLSVLSALLITLLLTSCDASNWNLASFMSKSNTDDKYMDMAGPYKPFQRLLPNGRLNISAKKDTDDLLVYSKLGNDGNRLSIWDPKKSEFLSIVDKPEKTAEIIRDNYLFLAPELGNNRLKKIDIHWLEETIDTNEPVLVIPLEEIMRAETGVGTIHEITIKGVHEGVSVFKTGAITVDKNDKIFYIRQADNNDAEPPVVVDQDMTNGLHKHPRYKPQIVVSEELGELAAALVKNLDADVGFSDLEMLTYEKIEIDPDTGLISYRFQPYSAFMGDGLDPTSTYHLVLSKSIGENSPLSILTMPRVVTQDLSGNAIECQTNEVDLGEYTTGEATNEIVCIYEFQTCSDVDGDGFFAEDECNPPDCNDSNPDINEDAEEICDYEDNNCNGSVDENFPTLSDPCTVGTGLCVNSGNLICSDDGAGVVCDVEPIPPQNEVCDYIDNDCDGQVDEDYKDPDGIYNLDEHCGGCNINCGALGYEAFCSFGVCERYDDNFEENDYKSTARHIGPYSYYSDLICRDDDWYLISMEPMDMGQLKVRIYFDHDQGNLDLELFDDYGQVDSSSSRTDNESAYAEVSYLGGGSEHYFIRVFSQDPTTANTYSLDVFFDENTLPWPF
jgi:Putative metal-binding motif